MGGHCYLREGKKAMKHIPLYFTLFILCGSMLGSEINIETIKPRYPRFVIQYLNSLQLSPEFQKFARTKRKIDQPVKLSAYAQLFENAQKEVGVAAEDTLPVHEISRDNFTAEACNDKIQISHKYFVCSNSPSWQRFVAFHEATHARYNDSAIHTWLHRKLILVEGLLNLPQLYVLWPGAYAPALQALPSATAQVAIYLTTTVLRRTGQHFLHQYKEWRADYESIQHLKCWKCAQEVMLCKAPDNEQHIKGAYMTREEIEPFVEKFKREGLLCTLHSDAEIIEISKPASNRIAGAAAIPPVPHSTMYDGIDMPLTTRGKRS